MSYAPTPYDDEIWILTIVHRDGVYFYAAKARIVMDAAKRWAPTMPGSLIDPVMDVWCEEGHLQVSSLPPDLRRGFDRLTGE